MGGVEDFDHIFGAKEGIIIEVGGGGGRYNKFSKKVSLAFCIATRHITPVHPAPTRKYTKSLKKKMESPSNGNQSNVKF